MVENKPVDTSEKSDSKKAAKKDAKKAEKAAKKAEHKANKEQSQTKVEDESNYFVFFGANNTNWTVLFIDDVSVGKYGTLPLIQSDITATNLDRKFTYVKDLIKSLSGTDVWVRARLHTVRARGKQCFIVLRQREFSVQVLVNVSDTVSKAMVKFSSTYVATHTMLWNIVKFFLG